MLKIFDVRVFARLLALESAARGSQHGRMRSLLLVMRYCVLNDPKFTVRVDCVSRNERGANYSRPRESFSFTTAANQVQVHNDVWQRENIDHMLCICRQIIVFGQ